MANANVNKVILGSETLIDLTGDTATAADVISGKSFHLASGAPATGILPYIDGFEGAGSNGEVTQFLINSNSTGYKIKSDEFDGTASTHSSAKYYNALDITDTNDNTIGSIQQYQLTNGRLGILFAAFSRASGSLVSCYLGPRVNPDGSGAYDISHPDAFRSAISAVDKSGDTMTGNLQISRTAGSYLQLRSSATNAQVGKTIPESNTSLGGYDVYDSASYRTFWSEVIKTTDDDLYKSFILRRKNASGTDIRNGFYLHINASGNPTVSFTDTATKSAWQSALGLNVAMGNPTIASGVGATVANNTSGKVGDLVSINLRLSGAKLAAGTADICTLPSGFRPSGQAFAVLLINGVYRNGAIMNTGVVRVYSGVAVNGVEIKILSTFMI